MCVRNLTANVCKNSLYGKCIHTERKINQTKFGKHSQKRTVQKEIRYQWVLANTNAQIYMRDGNQVYSDVMFD